MTQRQHGFTLVEVIVAMMILSFLSLFTVESIQRALKTKTKVQGDIDKNSTLRDALRIIERDINMAFNYRDVNTQLYNMAQKERQKAAQAKKGVPAKNPTTGNPGTGTPTSPVADPVFTPEDPNRFKLKEEKIETHFIGEPGELNFTSVSNIRMSEDSAISTQAEIGYRLKGCRRRSTQEQSSKCLWRRISNYIHEDITKEGQETVLLENVSNFSLRYLGPGRDGEWTDTWITNERGDDLSKGKFPYAVEITLEVRDPDPKAKDKTLKMTTVASIRNPNNPKVEPKDPATGLPANDQSTPATQ